MKKKNILTARKSNQISCDIVFCNHEVGVRESKERVKKSVTETNTRKRVVLHINRETCPRRSSSKRHTDSPPVTTGVGSRLTVRVSIFVVLRESGTPSSV